MVTLNNVSVRPLTLSVPTCRPERVPHNGRKPGGMACLGACHGSSGLKLGL